MTPGKHTLLHTFKHGGSWYLATIYHVLELTAEEIIEYGVTEDTYLVFLHRDEEDKIFELFINAGDTHWSTKSDLIDPAIVEILGNEIDHQSK